MRRIKNLVLTLGEEFVSSEKKIWKKPEIKAFTDAEEAIAYYARHGCSEHVVTIKRLRGEAEQERLDAEHEIEAAPDTRFRKAGRRWIGPS